MTTTDCGRTLTAPAVGSYSITRVQDTPTA